MSDAPAPTVATAPPDNGWPKGEWLEHQEHYAHWWREPVAGAIAVSISTYDAWFFDRDAGLSSSLDEILLLTGIALIAGIKNLFGTVTTPQKPLGTPPEAGKGSGGTPPP